MTSLLILALLVGMFTIMLTIIQDDGQTTKRMQVSAQARQNAMSALRTAIGELQAEMGPDMRVSSESALLDQDAETEQIDGVAQSRWLASHEAWGNWLNATYTSPETGETLHIANTYDSGRTKMFRRWLLSLPENLREDIDAPLNVTGWDDTNSVILVGEGSLGDTAATEPDKVTRAYLAPIGESGMNGWWIGPENHKARIDLARQQRNLTTDAWETSQGETAEVGVGALDGLEMIDDDQALAQKLISHRTLEVAGVDEDVVEDHFFDLTAHSEGVLTSVRTGHLKKDLSLLFEKPNSALPDLYRFDSVDVREPSIRPMSLDLLAKNPKTPGRHFASWTGMRHFYRMYRQDSDALAPAWTAGGTSGSPALRWDGSRPFTDYVGTSNCFTNSSTDWDGKNSYLRIPVLAKLTFIHSLLTQFQEIRNGKEVYQLYLVYTPVYTYWNPYNTELRIPDNTLAVLSSAYKALPIQGKFFLNGIPETGEFTISVSNTWSRLRSTNGDDVVFKPGEFRLFSHDSFTSGFTNEMAPGFDPQAYGGQKVRITGGVYSSDQNPSLELRFSHSAWGGNVNHGNTPGSLDVVQDWAPGNESGRARMALNYQIDWFNVDQTYTPITTLGEPARWVFDNEPAPVGYAQLTMKGLSEYDYESINWAKDWRCRNWLHSPASYFGNGLYISEDDAMAHSQRVNNPYVMNFGPMSTAEMPKVVGHIGTKAFLGSGTAPFEKVTAAPSLELPSAPVGSLAGFAAMKIKPGWTEFSTINSQWREQSGSWHTTGDRSLVGAEVKALAYQSGITGPGIGNSFLHPVIPRTEVYQFFNNSISMDPLDRRNPALGHNATDTKAFSDFWDHTFLLNDALFDDYFVSSLADQQRPGASSGLSLDANIDRLIAGDPIANCRFRHLSVGQTSSQTKAELQAADGYLKAARHLMVEGMFNVNSTSVGAWHALFTGIRERKMVYRDDNGELQEIAIPSDKRIGLSRFTTAVSDQEMDDPEFGVEHPDGSQGWSGVRFLDDLQLYKLAEECVKQVKRRGPFLNFSEFINRRLSNDDLGLMGTLQSAIDYDDDSPEPDSINYAFKNGPDFMMEASDLGTHSFSTPEAVEGSRFAGIPGYVIQSDLLKPIANTLSVRDDTFRIRAYGDVRDVSGAITSRAWCEAIVQRTPEYVDISNESDVPLRELNVNGEFINSGQLSAVNQALGRRFRIVHFRWLNPDEI